MILQPLTHRFLKFNLWANERLTSFLLSVDPRLVYEKTGSSFGTIDRTIQHMLFAQIYWHDILVNNTIKAFNAPYAENNIGQAIAGLIETSRRLTDGLAVLTDQQLMELVQVSDSKQSRYEYILHIVNHGPITAARS